MARENLRERTLRDIGEQLGIVGAQETTAAQIRQRGRTKDIRTGGTRRAKLNLSDLTQQINERLEVAGPETLRKLRQRTGLRLDDVVAQAQAQATAPATAGDTAVDITQPTATGEKPKVSRAEFLKQAGKTGRVGGGLTEQAQTAVNRFINELRALTPSLEDIGVAGGIGAGVRPGLSQAVETPGAAEVSPRGTITPAISDLIKRLQRFLGGETVEQAGLEAFKTARAEDIGKMLQGRDREQFSAQDILSRFVGEEAVTEKGKFVIRPDGSIAKI